MTVAGFRSKIKRPGGCGTEAENVPPVCHAPGQMGKLKTHLLKKGIECNAAPPPPYTPDFRPIEKIPKKNRKGNSR
jgi:hypothetical protein